MINVLELICDGLVKDATSWNHWLV